MLTHVSNLTLFTVSLALPSTSIPQISPPNICLCHPPSASDHALFNWPRDGNFKEEFNDRFPLKANSSSVFLSRSLFYPKQKRQLHSAGEMRAAPASSPGFWWAFFFPIRSAQNLHDFTYKTSSSQPKPAWGCTKFAMRFKRWKFTVPRTQEKQTLAAQLPWAILKGSNCRLTTPRLPRWNPTTVASPTKHSYFTEPRFSLPLPTRCPRGRALLAGRAAPRPRHRKPGSRHRCYRGPLKRIPHLRFLPSTCTAPARGGMKWGQCWWHPGTPPEEHLWATRKKMAGGRAQRCTEMGDVAPTGPPEPDETQCPRAPQHANWRAIPPQPRVLQDRSTRGITLLHSVGLNSAIPLRAGQTRPIGTTRRARPPKRVPGP